MQHIGLHKRLTRMNYRKIIIIPALFILSNVVYIGCCKCNDAALNYYNITKLFVTTNGSAKAIVDTGAVTTVDSIFINNDIYRDCVAQSNNNFSFLGNEAMACKCNECGREGLKNKIDSIIITSDSVYQNIAANVSLSNYFKVKQAGNNFISIDSFKNILNTASYASASEQYVITTKPNNSKGHIFKVKMRFADAKILTASTRRIYWQ
jgi:hypothetical protein